MERVTWGRPAFDPPKQQQPQPQNQPVKPLQTLKQFKTIHKQTQEPLKLPDCFKQDLRLKGILKLI
jgi:hypothetical protein